MKRLLLCLLLIVMAAPIQAVTLVQVRDKADQKLATLWTNVIRPKQLEWFAINGEYGQCLHTQNIPNNEAAHGVVQEMLPVTNVSPDDRRGVTCKMIFGAVNIDVSLPFAIAVHVYNGPDGHGFIGQVWVRYEGTIYTRAKNYGPETWHTHDWQEAVPWP